MLKQNISILLLQCMAVVAYAGVPVKAPSLEVIEPVNPSVVAEKQSENGMRLQIVEMPDGRKCKRVVPQFGTNKNQIEEISHRIVSVREESGESDVFFYENFESWDGETYDWIPVGWSDISKMNPPSVAPEDQGINPTWQVEYPSWDLSIEGKFFARIANNYHSDPETGQIVNEAQDEWLITPAISLIEGEWLNFYLCYHPGWVFFNTNTYKFDALNNVMEVHVSDDGGETWTQLWTCLEDAYTYSQKELYSSISSITGTWIPVRLSLEAYKGKTIQIAFRYVGNCGESMAIDCVSVKKPNPTALYTMPIGSFYSGYDSDFNLSSRSKVLTGPFNEVTFYNASNVDCIDFTWSYTTDGENTKLTSDLDLVAEYEPGEYSFPSLLAYAGNGASSTYASSRDVLRVGGSNVEVEDGVVTEYGACNYDSDKTVSYYTVGNKNLFGTGSDNFWTSYINMEGVTVKLSAICNYFPKPNHSFYFSRMWLNAVANTTANALFQLDVYRVIDGVIENRPIAQATCSGRDFIARVEGGKRYVTIPFDFGQKITVDTGLFVKLTGFDDTDNVTNFVMLSQYTPNVEGTNYAYIYLTGYKGTQSDDLLMPVSHINSSAGALCTSFCFNMDANFTWLECSDPYLYAGDKSQSKGLKFYTEYRADDFTITGDGVGDWITYRFGNYNEETHQQVVTFTVADNTGAKRASTVKVEIPGSVCNVEITQDAPAGIEAVNAVEKLVFDGCSIRVHDAEGERVSVYSALGVEVMETVVVGNDVTIATDELPAGIYVVRLSDGSTLKIAK